MTNLNESEISPEAVEAFARELSRVCPGWPGAVVTVHRPEVEAPPWQFDITPASRPAPLPRPAA